MGSFRRAFFGYRRAEVDAAWAAFDAAIVARDARIGELEGENRSLSGMFLGREREVGSLREQLAEANARHDRSLRALETVAMRVEEIHAQARGQATRIRMRALGDAVQIHQRVKEIAESIEIEPAATNGTGPSGPEAESARHPSELFDGLVEVEIGPLGDFSQLVGFEDAAGRISATSEISVRRFSEGRATLAMRLDEPVELLRELEERAPMEFRVRRMDGGRVVLDLDDDAEAA